MDSDSIEFNVTGSSAHYLDLAHSMINVKAKIVNEDGTDLSDDAQVGPVNVFLHSLFSEVDITLNDRLVSSATNNYAYRVIIESLLSFGDSAKKSQLTSALFFKDTAGRMNQNNPVAEGANNEGIKQRYQFTKGSQVVDLFGPIHSDIFFQDRLLLNGVSLKLKFHRSKNAFCLLTPLQTDKYKVQIMDATFYVRKVSLSPSIALTHAKMLDTTTAKYPLRRVENLSFTRENLFLGQIPKRIVIGIVGNRAYNGDYRQNHLQF